MKRTLIATVLLLIAGASVFAQTVREMIEENPDRAANIYHSYETFGMEQTPAPKGYTPFYISHYGRHGSRYHTGLSFLNRPVAFLDTLEKQDALSEKGKELLDDLRAYVKAHIGLEGALTQTGCGEHRGIAQRMYERFPAVFNQKDRNEVQTVTSIIPRCLQSMASFASELKSHAPGLSVSMYTGNKFMDYIAHDVPGKAETQYMNKVRDSMTFAMIDPARMLSVIMKEPQKVMELSGVDGKIFIRDLYYAGAIRQDIETELPDIYRKYFTTDELYECWEIDDVRMFAGFGKTTELGPFRTVGVGHPLLKDFIEKADEAIAKGNRAADLRFGHDTGIAPLLFLLKVKNCEWEGSMLKGPQSWVCFRDMCMGSNVQMIFFKNKTGDIIVKILHNERETTMEGLPTYTGPYYRWSDLREYFLKLVRN